MKPVKLFNEKWGTWGFFPHDDPRKTTVYRRWLPSGIVCIMPDFYINTMNHFGIMRSL